LESLDAISDGKFFIHHSIGLPSTNEDDGLEHGSTILRAIPEFHNKQIFNDICFEDGIEMRHSKMCLIFSIAVMDNEIQNTRIEKLCLVRLYKELLEKDSLQFPILTWETDEEREYKVIRIEQILKPIHIVKIMMSTNKFYINMHKFW
jgi:hypothetical protein